MRRTLTIWGLWGFGMRLPRPAVWVLACIVGQVVLAQPVPPGATVSDPVIQAHQAVQTARLDTRFATYYCYPDETEFITASYSVVLDRPGNRVRIDRPGFTLVCDSKDIFLTATALPGRHLRVPLNGPLTYETLLQIVPDLAHPTAPGLIMLLSGKPMAVLSDGLAKDATAMGQATLDGKRVNQLKLPMQLGSCILSSDLQTQLLDQALIEIDPKNLQNAPVQAVRFHYEITWSDVGKPVDDKLFELDLKKSHEMTSMAQFLSNGGPGGPGAAAGQGPGGAAPSTGPATAGASPPNTLVGMPLPDLELKVLGEDKTINLFKQNKGVVIAEFYASWTKASTLDLPVLTEFKAWCKEQGTPIKVYAVAVGETKESMTPWIDALEKTAKKKIDLPVLLDTEMKAGMAMKLPTVPRTIIAVDGRVVDVFGGTKPNFMEDLKKGLPVWQGKDTPEDEKPEAPGAEDKPVVPEPAEPVKPEDPGADNEVKPQEPEPPVEKPQGPKKAPRAPR